MRLCGFSTFSTALRMKQTKDENVNGEESQTLTRIKHRIILGIALGD
jgi:hypothetical protein